MKKLNTYCVTLIVIVTKVAGYYTYHKVIIKNVFEEIYNSYFTVLPLRAIDNMGQIKPIRRNDQGFDVKKFYYKEQVNGSNIEFSLINFDDEKKIFIIS